MTVIIGINNGVFYERLRNLAFVLFRHKRCWVHSRIRGSFLRSGNAQRFDTRDDVDEVL